MKGDKFNIGDVFTDDVTVFADENYDTEFLPDVCQLTMTKELFYVINTLHSICTRYKLKSVSRHMWDMTIVYEWLNYTYSYDGVYEEEYSKVYFGTTCLIDFEEFVVYANGNFQIIGWQRHTGVEFRSPSWSLNHE